MPHGHPRSFIIARSQSISEVETFNHLCSVTVKLISQMTSNDLIHF
jgi:hypothetical protein